jgi:hypothetical protein
MERHKDLTDLTDALQSVMSRVEDAPAKLQYARHQVNMLSANEKTVKELIAQLNDFFFRDIVPALKRAKQMPSEDSAMQKQGQDPLDCYLENGEGGSAMPQDFVDDMSGWAGNAEAGGAKDTSSTLPSSRENVEPQSDAELDDELSAVTFHDRLVFNGLKFTALQAPDYSGMRFAGGPAVQQQSAPPQVGGGAVSRQASLTPSPVPANPRAAKEDVKTSRCRVVPPPIVTDLPPRSNSSTPRTQSRSPDASTRKDRIGKRTAASLTAEQVLAVRTYGTVREYLIRWQGVASPLWIARRKAPPQAKEMIGLYAAELRSRDSALASERAGQAGGEPPNGRKKTSRTGARLRQGQHNKVQPDFYTVDHIVDHRSFYSKRQYLVRWENYDASEDTWEDASKLRADVPDIVDAYEGQLARERGRAEAVQSAISELARDTAAESKESAHKRGISRAGDANAKGKRRRVVQNGGGAMKPDDDGDTSEDDYQFTLEEAEVEELSDDEFADKLNT